MSVINTHIQSNKPSFGNALWVTGLLLRLAMVTIFIAVLKFSSGSILSLALAMLADLLLFLFQLLRYATASSYYLAETGRFWTVTGGAAGYFFAAVVSLVLWGLAIMAIEEQASKGGTGEDVTFTTLKRPDIKTPPKRFRAHLSSDGRSLSFDGVMSRGTMADLDPLMYEAANLESITLSSPGGDLNEARKLAQRIAEYGLDTHVVKECSSSCLLAFAAGANRTMGPGAQMGFHRYGLDFKQLMPGVELDKERLRDMRFYQQQRISEEFLNRYFREDRRTLWYPHKNELMAAGFITQR